MFERFVDLGFVPVDWMDFNAIRSTLPSVFPSPHG